jgi:hypothetical protein
METATASTASAASATVAPVQSTTSTEVTAADNHCEGTDSTPAAADAHVCATAGCGKTATLACPTCLKLGLAPTRFCSQECFKSSWNEHKCIHKQVKTSRVDPSSLPSEFKGYSFTGSLRPFQKSPLRSVPAHILRPDYADHPQVPILSTVYLLVSNLPTFLTGNLIKRSSGQTQQ